MHHNIANRNDLMTQKEVWDIVYSSLLHFGSASAIIIALTAYLSKIWATRIMEKDKNKLSQELEEIKKELLKETDTYRIKLKKSEFIFEKEFIATSEFILLYNKLYPRHYKPEMEYDDLINHITGCFSNIETQLKEYIENHGAVLSEEIIALIYSTLSSAGEGQHLLLPDEEYEAADVIYENYLKIRKLLKENINSQIAT